MHVYIHMQMLITQYTHAGVPAMRVYTHIQTQTNKTNKQSHARMHTLRNTENYTYIPHIRRINNA